MTIRTIPIWRDFAAGQRIIMLVETRGATADDDEVVYPIGSPGIIDATVDFGAFQGKGAHVTIGVGDRAICNSFDDGDVEELGAIPFRRFD
jgi:hypothetical protein